MAFRVATENTESLYSVGSLKRETNSSPQNAPHPKKRKLMDLERGEVVYRESLISGFKKVSDPSCKEV